MGLFYLKMLRRFILMQTTVMLALGVILNGNMVSLAAADGPEITIYNQNFGLVKEYRALAIAKGISEVTVDDVAGLIDPTSVHFKSLTAPQEVTVLEQNFRYDLINRANILNRLVGKPIRFVKEGQVKSGTLLNPATAYVRSTGYNSSPYSKNVYQSTNEVFAVQTSEGVLLTKLEDVIVDALPPGLYPKPALTWLLESTKGGIHETEIAYLTDGLNWYADYVAVLDDAKNTLDLTGWVTLDNQSGASYNNAQLKLVAGDVRKLVQNNPQGYVMAEMAVAPRAAKRQFQQEELFEYHLYSLNTPTDIRNNETKQVALIAASAVPVNKKYIYDPDKSNPFQWFQGQRPGDGRATSNATKVATLVQLTNTESNHLGMALPKGRIRVNLADSSGSLQFVGEDEIDHTPTDELIELYLGDAFDLVGEKKRTHYEQNGGYYQESYQVTLRNHKKSSVTIHVIDHVYGDWDMRASSVAFTTLDSDTVDWAVTVPAKGEQTLTYTLRINQK